MIFFCCELKAIDKSWWKKLLVHARISHFAQESRGNLALKRKNRLMQ